MCEVDCSSVNVLHRAGNWVNLDSWDQEHANEVMNTPWLPWNENYYPMQMVHPLAYHEQYQTEGNEYGIRYCINECMHDRKAAARGWGDGARWKSAVQNFIHGFFSYFPNICPESCVHMFASHSL